MSNKHRKNNSPENEEMSVESEKSAEEITETNGVTSECDSGSDVPFEEAPEAVDTESKPGEAVTEPIELKPVAELQAESEKIATKKPAEKADVHTEKSLKKADKKAEKADKKSGKMKKFGKGHKKKIIKRVILIVVLVILIVLCLFCLGRRNITWAKKTSDILHLDKIPKMEAITTALPLDELFDMLNIGENTVSASSETIQVYTVTRRTIQSTLTGTGTLMPLEEYTVSALTSGEIIEDYFEEGDVVVEDQILMKIDSSNLDTSLSRAQNNYDDAVESLNDLEESLDDLYITSKESGVIQTINFDPGDTIRTGDIIATVVDRDVMLIDIPFMQADAANIRIGETAVLTIGSTFEEIIGTVDSKDANFSVNGNGVRTVDVTIAVSNPGVLTENVEATAKIGEYSCTGASTFYYNVNKTIVADVAGEIAQINKKEGDRVYVGETVVVLDSENIDDSIEKAKRSVDDAKNALDDAKEAYENYDVTAPISGTVVKKYYKKGEKIGSSAGSTIAEIYDMSSLIFEMSIDELDIDSIKMGQEVKVTSDAKPGMTYTGVVTKISIQGVTTNGTTSYPITVTINDYGQDIGNALRPGMNIDAEIIVEEAVNAIAIPVDAVARGNRVTVVKNKDAVKDVESGSETEERSQSQGSMPGYPGGRPGNTGEMSGRPENAGEMLKAPENMTENAEAADTNAQDRTTEQGSSDRQASQNQYGERPQNSGYGRGGMNGGYTTLPANTETEEIIVETGINDDNYIEILSGLEEGDLVVIQTATATQANAAASMMGGFGGMGGMGGGMSGGMSGGMGGGMSGGMGGGMSGNRGSMGGNMGGGGRPGM